MKEYIFIDAVTYLDSDLIENHIKQMQKNKTKKHHDLKKHIIKYSAIAAACIVLTICLLPFLHLPTKSDINNSESMSETIKNNISLEEIQSLDILYSKLNFNTNMNIQTNAVYNTLKNSNDEITREIIEINIMQKYSFESNYPNLDIQTDNVTFTVKFGIKKITVNPFESNFLVKTINSTDVYCSSRVNGNGTYGEAKFVFEGNLYIIEIYSASDKINFDFYLDMILK